VPNIFWTPEPSTARLRLCIMDDKSAQHDDKSAQLLLRNIGEIQPSMRRGRRSAFERAQHRTEQGNDKV
jgi:hypothetical protein